MLILLHELQHRLIVVQHHGHFVAVDHLQLVHLHVALLLKFSIFFFMYFISSILFSLFFSKQTFGGLTRQLYPMYIVIYMSTYEHILSTISFLLLFSLLYYYYYFTSYFFSRVNFLYVI